MAEDAAELAMEALDGGVTHWDKIKDTTKKTFHHDDHSPRRRSSSSRKRSDDDSYRDSRRRSYDHDRYERGERGRYEPSMQTYHEDEHRRDSRRPGLNRRTSSLDRGEFIEHRRSRRGDFDSPDSRRDSRASGRDRRKPESSSPDGWREKVDKVLSGRDPTTAITAGIATVGTAIVANMLYDSYKDREKRSRRASRPK